MNSQESHIKEFTRFKAECAERSKRIDALEKSMTDIKKDMSEISANIKELLEIMNALSLGRRLLIGLFWFLGSIIAILVGLKSLFGWFK